MTTCRTATGQADRDRGHDSSHGPAVHVYQVRPDSGESMRSRPWPSALVPPSHPARGRDWTDRLGRPARRPILGKRVCSPNPHGHCFYGTAALAARSPRPSIDSALPIRLIPQGHQKQSPRPQTQPRRTARSSGLQPTRGPCVRGRQRSCHQLHLGLTSAT